MEEVPECHLRNEKMYIMGSDGSICLCHDSCLPEMLRLISRRRSFLFAVPWIGALFRRSECWYDA